MLSYFGRNSLYIFACHWPWLGLLEHELPTWIPDPKAMCLVTTVTVLAISLLMGAALRRWLPFVFR
jgi:fucose 4-O-acetylase-like acetyltransferase